jgi:addiction module HigA family antidote
MFKVEREPTSPGEILDEEFLKPLHITQKQLADHLGCDVKVINRIVNHRTSVTAGTAVRLASALGTSPEFWLNAQQAVDLYCARKKIKAVPEPLGKTRWRSIPPRR